MRYLLNRWSLGTIILLGLLSLVVCFARSGSHRITREQFDRLQVGMSIDELTEIMGNPDRENGTIVAGISFDAYEWRDYPSWIRASTTDGIMTDKSIHIATLKEWITWRCRELLHELGI